MTNSMTKPDDQAGVQNTAMTFLLICGFSCFITWPLIAFLWEPQPLAVEGVLPHAGILTLSFFFGAFLTLIAALWVPFAKWFFSLRQFIPFYVLLAIPFAICPVYQGFITAGTDISPVLEAVIWASCGISFASMLLSWGDTWDSYVSVYGVKQAAVNILMSVAIATLAGFMISYMPFEIYAAALGILPLFSLVASRALIFHAEKRREPGKPTVEGIVKMPVRHASYVVAISTYLSFTIFRCAVNVGLVVTMSIAGTAILITCALFAILHMVNGHLPRFLLVERIAFPVAVSGTLLSPFLDHPAVSMVMLFISMLGTSAFMISHWELLVKWSKRFLLQPIYHYSYGTFTFAGGFLLGAAVNVAIQMLGIPAVLPSTLFCLIALFGIVVISAFSPYDSETVFNSFEGGVVQIYSHEGLWKATIDLVAEKYKLTPRESEVLVYLAKGRSVKHISTSLVVSEHTVKTHVYHIYKKLEINGLQELIDLVDDELSVARQTASHQNPGE